MDYLWAFIIAFVDLLPVLGTGIIVIPWAIFSLVQDRFAFGAGMLIAYTIITIVRQIIEPKIVGEQVGLPAIVTLMAMFLGVRFIGVFGIFKGTEILQQCRICHTESKSCPCHRP